MDHFIRTMFQSIPPNANLIDEFLGNENMEIPYICILKIEMSMGSEEMTKIGNT